MGVIANTRAVSSTAAGVAGDAASGDASFSPNGSHALFTSLAANLVAGDDNGVSDVFLKNIVTGAVSRVSVDVNGAQANGASTALGFGASGASVLFLSGASNLIGSDPDGAAKDIFRKDISSGTVTLVSDGGASHFANTQKIALSQDGSKIIFDSTDGSLGGFNDSHSRIYVQSLSGGPITAISNPMPGVTVGEAYSAIFSPDGAKAAFISTTAYTTADTNGHEDVFVVDLNSGVITNVSKDIVNWAGIKLDSFSPDGSKLYFDELQPSRDPTYAPRVFAYVLVDQTLTLQTPPSQSAVFSPDNRLFASDTLHYPPVGQATGQYLAPQVTALDGSSPPADLPGEAIVFSADGHLLLTTNNGQLLVSDVSVNLTAPPGGAQLNGGAADDVLNGGVGADILVGNAGADVFYGGDGNDYVYGGDGADVAHGGAGVDVLVLGVGNDIGYGDDGSDYLFGGDGNDILYGGAGVDVLQGEAGADILIGGDGGDYLYGGDGADTLYGEAGNDIIVGGPGAGTLIGGAGNDYLYGGADGSHFYGGDGVDVMVGGAGDDVFEGGAGVDYAFLGGGRNTVVADAAADGVIVVNQFDPTRDTLWLAHSFSSFADVVAHTTENGSYTIVTLDGDTAIWLSGIHASQLTASDFSFH